MLGDENIGVNTAANGAAANSFNSSANSPQSTTAAYSKGLGGTVAANAITWTVATSSSAAGALAWTQGEMHQKSGNLGLTDGSVQSATVSGLHTYMLNSTNTAINQELELPEMII